MALKTFKTLLIFFISLIGCKNNSINSGLSNEKITIKGSLVGGGIVYVNYGLDSVKVQLITPNDIYETYTTEYGDFIFEAHLLTTNKVKIKSELTSFFDSKVYIDKTLTLNPEHDTVDVGQLTLEGLENPIQPLRANNYWEFNRSSDYSTHGAGGTCEKTYYEGKEYVTITDIVEDGMNVYYEVDIKSQRTSFERSYFDNNGNCVEEVASDTLITNSTLILELKNGILISETDSFFSNLLFFYPDISKWPFTYDSWNQDGPYRAVNTSLSEIYGSCSQNENDPTIITCSSGRASTAYKKNVGLIEYFTSRGGNFSFSSESIVLLDSNIN